MSGGPAPDRTLVIALLLNVALILIGWRRHTMLSTELLVTAAAEQRAQQLAARDPLTGFLNRRSFPEEGAALLTQTTRKTKAVAMIMLDLDHFKLVNDTLGHAAGDVVLAALGQALRTTLRATDYAGRYGGEEFMVVLTSEEPDAFLRRLRAEWTKVRPQPVTFSAGVAPAAPGLRHAVEAADRAMYRAKQAGRDQWHTATDDDYR
jgi:diguanylate cyclase (GGDEF)-like protein